MINSIEPQNDKNEDDHVLMHGYLCQTTQMSESRKYQNRYVQCISLLLLSFFRVYLLQRFYLCFVLSIQYSNIEGRAFRIVSNVLVVESAVNFTADCFANSTHIKVRYDNLPEIKMKFTCYIFPVKAIFVVWYWGRVICETECGLIVGDWI